MMLQLDPPIPLRTSRGEGLAHFLIDYGPEYSLIWVTFMQETVPNEEIRARPDWTMGRRYKKEPVPSIDK